MSAILNHEAAMRMAATAKANMPTHQARTLSLESPMDGQRNRRTARRLRLKVGNVELTVTKCLEGGLTDGGPAARAAKPTESAAAAGQADDQRSSLSGTFDLNERQ